MGIRKHKGGTTPTPSATPGISNPYQPAPTKVPPSCLAKEGFLDYDGGNDVEDGELELVGSAAEAAEASENSPLLAHPQRKEGGGVGNRV